MANTEIVPVNIKVVSITMVCPTLSTGFAVAVTLCCVTVCCDRYRQ